ncbi:hypothetical protein HYPP_02452 [Hyphomicrobium sp. ghe19]|nr:hypothetical protein HYPP_02452 [Hyphomicrobium sp. ghe19]
MSREPKSTLVFVGRIQKIKSASHPGTHAYRFRILTPGQGAGSLTLSYPDQRAAKAAQQQLLRAEHSHYVGSKKLFDALWEALGLAEEHGKSNSQQ